MADNARLRYQLSQAESVRWQQGGLAARLVQQSLAEAQHQGSLGFASTLDVFHPDGILAAQFLAPSQNQTVPAPVHAAVPEVSEASESRQRPPQTATPSTTRAEGTLIETSSVTAYQMSVDESAAWARGGHDTRAVEHSIGAALQDAAPTRAVPVLLDDGRAAYTHGSNPFQVMAEELRHVHPLQGLSEQFGKLRDRLSGLSSEVNIHMDFSVRIGPEPSRELADMAALQQRADRLSAPAQQQSQDQGMSRW